jgi:hypothetical protein
MKRHFFATVLGVLAWSTLSLANIRMSEPAPRSAADNLTMAPCGGEVAKPGVYAKVAQGANVTVKFEETVGSEGCYQVAWSKDGNTFDVYSQVADPANAQGMQTVTVKAPAVSCPTCILQLRQLAVSGGCTSDAGFQMPQGTTYYTCADVCVGDTCPPIPVVDAGSDAASSSSSGGASSGGPITTRPDAGGDPRVFDGTDGVNSGCSGAGSSGNGIGAGVVGLIALVSLLAKRRTASSK